jgi:hypothetical protein
MKKRFTEEQIMGVLKEADAGARMSSLLYRWTSSPVYAHGLKMWWLPRKPRDTA